MGKPEGSIVKYFGFQIDPRLEGEAVYVEKLPGEASILGIGRTFDGKPALFGIVQGGKKGYYEELPFGTLETVKSYVGREQKRREVTYAHERFRRRT
jgi:hypothetical protein